MTDSRVSPFAAGFTVDRERAVLYTQKIRGRLAQPVRVPGLHPGCRGSESLIVQISWLFHRPRAGAYVSMMSDTAKYAKHFLLDVRTAAEYARDKLDFFDAGEDLGCVEIGDGNINYVFKVFGKTSGKSLVIKQADTVLRSSGRPLDMHRNKIEAEILKIEKSLAPGFVPEIYRYDEAMFALSMEDISAYKNLRKELATGKIFPALGDALSTFLADTLLPTTDLVIGRAEKKERVKLFTNPELCDISEDLVFTEPYWDYKKRNVVIPENARFVEEALYKDKELHACVAQLRDDFMNRAQALVHGDLHSGSIFVNESGIKVIDPEFAFYGPMGYDVGNVVGNLFLAYANAYWTKPENADFLSWLQNTIALVFDSFKTKFEKKYDALVEFPLYKTERFKRTYTERLLADSAGYAGTEIIRRVVGDAKVSEVTSVTDIALRVPLERCLILLGKTLIKRQGDMKAGCSLVQAANDIFGCAKRGNV